MNDGDCCINSWIGNGICDDVNNFPSCGNYDGGDCRPPNITDWLECPHNPELIGDGKCDEHLKTKIECNHDSGDCCTNELIGNKVCDDFNNFLTCQNYDGGDCRLPNITKWSECPHNPEFIGDLTCDDHLRNAHCNYDSDDCKDHIGNIP